MLATPAAPALLVKLSLPAPASSQTLADEVADVYSGLQGAIIIGRKGQLRPDSLVAKQVRRRGIVHALRCS